MNEGNVEAAAARTADSGARQRFGVALRRMLGEMNRLVHGFALEQKLHPTDIHALSFVMDSSGAATPGMLREHLGLTSGAVTACLDRLEKAGHIRRSRADDDRRVVRIHYDEGARSVARAYFMPLAQAADRASGRFSDDELATVLRYLDALNDELGELRVPPRT
ncbi:MarR family winged helix-turn-helix transcriptional regulator [Streptomyces roseofulvus]|uniref:MarR family winged helix-turn-helix transcriptional regulator n=2 Tax=Streptomyces TaxID=1883 RepID=A0ABU4K6Y3_9ACTN|nr:MarR family winged helix-turn-helix transcriptional regulator [Streptomyces roseolus]MDX2293512.1 MarR family winged helix-turn-helix transcriptional regulator [Streptomyces roseolus]